MGIEIKLSDAIRVYLETITGKKSPRTVSVYRDSLSKFLNFAGDITIEEIKVDFIISN